VHCPTARNFPPVEITDEYGISACVTGLTPEDLARVGADHPHPAAGSADVFVYFKHE